MNTYAIKQTETSGIAEIVKYLQDQNSDINCMSYCGEHQSFDYYGSPSVVWQFVHLYRYALEIWPLFFVLFLGKEIAPLYDQEYGTCIIPKEYTPIANHTFSEYRVFTLFFYFW